MNIINKENVEEFKQHILDGKTIPELAEIYKCGNTTIVRAKDTFGLKGLIQLSVINDKNAGEFKQHILNGKTIKELQELYNCSRSVITSAKKTYGLIGLSPNSKKRDNGDGTKTCNVCLTKKSVNEFYSNGYALSGATKLKSACKLCENITRYRLFYKKIFEILAEQEKEYKCSLCGYDANYSALVFHHIDPTIKVNLVSNMKTANKETLTSEIEKCMVLCQNCHHALHNPSQQKDIFIKQVLG